MILDKFGKKTHHIESYKHIQEPLWWKLIKFPLLLVCIVAVQKYSPAAKSELYMLVVFFAAAWFEICMHIYRINKRLDLLYLNEPSARQEDE